ncbi:alpha/beta hydrolase [Brevibacillus sp. M2.1A]|uniref:alpha/beta hydrolase n=1 Tax=Brevibacillus sp. M2.1A TaxID=2738980 RepID=UPI001E3DB5D6|nr:alpha/beta hydrolase [Brevibacillus sp. M2.1A]MCC8438540.1 alpha/beta hydrolase [Brevibacillus sp. M2.1A]
MKKMNTMLALTLALGTAFSVNAVFENGNIAKAESSAEVTQEMNATQKKQKMTFVLIHGAWADASYWKETAKSLRKAGHTVHTPEYAGHGANFDAKVTHEEITKSVVDYIKKNNLHDVVLVGHSFGGTIIAKVTEQVPNDIKRLVFLDAFIPKDGESMMDQVPEHAQKIFESLRDASGDNTITLPFPVFRETFANKATLEQAKEIYAVAPKEPAGPMFEKLDLKKFYSLENIPKSYVYQTEDTALPPAPFAWHPAQSSHLGLYRLIVTEGDHMSTVHNKPDLIAEKLIEAGRD